MNLHLASSSPRRTEILQALRLDFSSGGADVDERQMPAELPDEMVLRLAAAKAQAASADHSGVILGADTVVALSGEIFGKPQDRTDGLEMLRRLSGGRHTVYTGVAALHADGSVRSALSSTEVQFREIRPDEAAAYWHSGEPCDKAGAYAIQGLGGMFVESISGSYSGVVGLPVFETVQLLRDAGIRVLND